MKGRADSKRQARGGRKRGRHRRGRLPRSRSSRAAGGVKAPALRGPRSPAAGGRKLPGGKSEPPLRGVSAPRGRWPAPPAPRGAEKARGEDGQRHKVRRLAPARPPPRTCSGGRPRSESWESRLARSARAPAPGPAAPRHSLQDFAEPPAPRALWPLRGDSPQTITRKRGGARESETCGGSPGSREEATAVHARNAASDPAGQAPATCAECRARRACAHLEPTPVPERRAPRAARCPPLPRFTLPREQSELARVSASPGEAPS